MHAWTWAFLGGSLLGLGGAVLWAVLGRTTGISGIAAGIVRGQSDRDWRVAFLLGLAAAGAASSLVAPEAFRPAGSAEWPAMPVVIGAGLLVGIGTRIGNGCTSGHGICGTARVSKRSLAATFTFCAVGIATVALLRAVGGAS